MNTQVANTTIIAASSTVRSPQRSMRPRRFTRAPRQVMAGHRLVRTTHEDERLLPVGAPTWLTRAVTPGS